MSFGNLRRYFCSGAGMMSLHAYMASYREITTQQPCPILSAKVETRPFVISTFTDKIGRACWVVVPQYENMPAYKGTLPARKQKSTLNIN